MAELLSIAEAVATKDLVLKDMGTSAKRLEDVLELLKKYVNLGLKVEVSPNGASVNLMRSFEYQDESRRWKVGHYQECVSIASTDLTIRTIALRIMALKGSNMASMD